MTRRMHGRAAAAALLSGIVLAACGSAGSGGPGGTTEGQVLAPGESTDDLTITFASTPDPLESGENALAVTVTEPDGTPVTDATVTMVFSMPAMPSMNMPAMRSDATLEHDGDGRYRGTGRLSMGGTWNVALTVTRGADTVGSRRLSIVARD